MSPLLQRSADPLSLHWAHSPPAYVARKLSGPALRIDGDLDKPQWCSAPWSTPFDEIRGRNDAPLDARPHAQCRTRIKMLWDEEFLYIAALLEYDRNMPLIATFTRRNSPIFHQDSDFEVFLDTDSSCHNYKELELNALNTVWNLLMDRPYGDGGSEHSGRVAVPGDPLFYDVSRQRTAVRVVRGAISRVERGDPAGMAKDWLESAAAGPRCADAGEGPAWAVEVALAHSESVLRTAAQAPPTVGSFWRINFSRVENKGETNWVWAPQRTWDPASRRYRGVVDMHRPDAWGYVVFGDERGYTGAQSGGHGAEALPSYADVGSASVEAREGQSDEEGKDGWRDVLWPAKMAAYSCYYAQRHFFEAHGRCARHLSELQVEPNVVAPFDIRLEVGDGNGTGRPTDAAECLAEHWTVHVDAGHGVGRVSVRNDRLVTVVFGTGD